MSSFITIFLRCCLHCIALSHSFVKNQLIIFTWVYFWALLFHSSTCLVTSVRSITLIISFNIMLAFLDLFASLQTICLYPQNNLLAFWLRLTDSIDQVEKHWRLNNIESSYPWTPRARHLGSVRSGGPEEALLWAKLAEVVEFQLSSFKSQKMMLLHHLHSLCQWIWKTQ